MGPLDFGLTTAKRRLEPHLDGETALREAVDPEVLTLI